ncbi:MAG: hypothetical protein COW69_00110 [Candidatus Huberarchaeum crystalense]|uniref:Methyltransferase type 11 domain-containing protein n=1 Tax=Huberarchaeum crystalense TaxID=2014257 RepID=A0A2G9LJS9_HUBC1|nr:MAG: hypothetical protein AUJ91_00450 [archaeon CG2_30_31_98]PIN66789.1 MAG: hypothetical protein COW69_00110 [Candidatus Huberarchaeum crystalense]PJC01268.1 MAG: hypothetical protein CO072_01835 [Candidatus Huberarchaeum crystalense]
MKILDIGCGRNKYKSITKGDIVISLDRVKLHRVDIVHDLEKFSLPFRDNEFDKVIAFHVLEHIKNFIPLMAELHRIMKAGAILEIKVPFYSAQVCNIMIQRIKDFSPFLPLITLVKVHLPTKLMEVEYNSKLKKEK